MCIIWKVFSGCFADIWNLHQKVSKAFQPSAARRQNATMKDSRSPEIVRNMTNSCPFILKRGNETRVWCSCSWFQSLASRRAAGGRRQVKTRAPDVGGRGGWGSRTRSPEWWRSLRSVCAHAARGATRSQMFIWRGFLPTVRRYKSIFRSAARRILFRQS